MVILPKWIERQIFEEYARLLAATTRTAEIVRTDAEPKPVGTTVRVNLPERFR